MPHPGPCCVSSKFLALFPQPPLTSFYCFPCCCRHCSCCRCCCYCCCACCCSCCPPLPLQFVLTCTAHTTSRTMDDACFLTCSSDGLVCVWDAVTFAAGPIAVCHGRRDGQTERGGRGEERRYTSTRIHTLTLSFRYSCTRKVFTPFHHPPSALSCACACRCCLTPVSCTMPDSCSSQTPGATLPPLFPDTKHAGPHAPAVSRHATAAAMAVQQIRLAWLAACGDTHPLLVVLVLKTAVVHSVPV